MSIQVIKGSKELGDKIRSRRNSLKLSIEEAAAKAGVGSKTWSRYESGESIRRDKVLGICKVLNWSAFPGSSDDQTAFDIEDYKKDKAWPSALAECLGEAAAVSFVVGSGELLYYLDEDLEALTHKPKGTHVGELDFAWMEGILPQQFLMNYDYDFLFYMRSVLLDFRRQAANGKKFEAHTVLEELVLYLCMEESSGFMEEFYPESDEFEEDDDASSWDSWAFDLFDDMDICTYLYSGRYLKEKDPYHFVHWTEEQFYMDSDRD